jgi:hypothetical protein
LSIGGSHSFHLIEGNLQRAQRATVPMDFSGRTDNCTTQQIIKCWLYQRLDRRQLR